LGLALEEPMEGDIVETINGIQVAIEDSIHGETKKLTLDYKETPSGSGLVMLGTESCC
jgi:hypothetical protein